MSTSFSQIAVSTWQEPCAKDLFFIFIFPNVDVYLVYFSKAKEFQYNLG